MDGRYRLLYTVKSLRRDKNQQMTKGMMTTIMITVIVETQRLERAGSDTAADCALEWLRVAANPSTRAVTRNLQIEACSFQGSIPR